ncbi:GMC family oxidoreductase [Armatimonas sp.]|uniref:GMC family oxidoreductase n=1 Tax=Armatimonas sp. TaxID=1872638 RepID=UPI003751EEA3
MKFDCDVIVIGSGAGGGVVAGLLAEAGRRVLLLERGGEPSFEEVGRDHLRNQRLSHYGHNAGPDADHPRVYLPPARSSLAADPLRLREGDAKMVEPWDGGYHANAAIVGGGTRVYGAQAWRFHPLDFKMASTYGVPDGSSLADWPIEYQELAPFYEQAEQEIGVCGQASAMWHLPEYRKDYPMPPMAVTKQGMTYRKGAAALGWRTLPVPLAINSTEYNGRPACTRCQHCVGFACPVDAKNGSQNTLIARGKLTGRLFLQTGAMVAQINHDGKRASGITYFIGDEAKTTTAEQIIVAAGAIESARLLQLSGIGNQNDQVGRHLQGHVYVGATALFPNEIWDGLGPGVSTATTEWSHGNEGIVGGGMLADEFVLLPIIAWKRYRAPGVPTWGKEAKNWLRQNYRHLSDIKGPVQDIPSPDARVTLDPNVKDRWGLPVARLSGTTHPETIRTGQFLQKKAVEWLEASGAKQIWGGPPTTLSLSGGQHQAGTCRMSDDPSAGVVDRNGRVHGFENVFVGDGSVHVTNGGFNPVLTIFALAFRLGAFLTHPG